MRRPGVGRWARLTWTAAGSGFGVLLVVAAGGGAAPTAGVAPSTPERFHYGAAGEVTLYRPSGDPVGVALFVSGDGGWNQGVVEMAERIRALGGLVVGIDIRTFIRNLAASGEVCAYPAGDLEQLSRAVQLHLKLPAYLPPVLVGYSSGATLVYAALASAPSETFAGAISLGFCPDLEMGKPLCEQRGLVARPRAAGKGFDLLPAHDLKTPWFVLQGEADRVCDPAKTRAYLARVPSGRLRSLPKVGHGFSVPRNWEFAFVEGWRTLTAPRESLRPSLAAVEDLPLVELPAAPVGHEDRMAVVMSGDGGWAEFDKGLAAALTARGLPVVGWNSLRYFWSPRTPEAAAQDLERVLRHYLAAWGRKRALLVGYSFGADLLPFVVSRLSPDLRPGLAGLGLLGLSANASFEFHVTSWVGGGGESRYATVPEVRRLAGLPVTCVRGAEESASACAQLQGVPGVRVVSLPGGHHFGGDSARVVDVLLEEGVR